MATSSLERIPQNQTTNRALVFTVQVVADDFYGKSPWHNDVNMMSLAIRNSIGHDDCKQQVG